MARNLALSALVGATTLLVACAMDDEPQVASVGQNGEQNGGDGGGHDDGKDDDHDRDKVKVKLEFFDEGTTLKTKALIKLEDHNKVKRVVVILNARGKAIVVCKNPAGKEPPGQTKEIEVRAFGDEKVDVDKKDEDIFVKVETKEPKLKDIDSLCPNDNFEAKLKDVKFNEAKLIIIFSKDGKTEKQTIDCKFSSPTHDGNVPKMKCQISKGGDDNDDNDDNDDDDDDDDDDKRDDGKDY
jgi:hypothetical protein